MFGCLENAGKSRYFIFFYQISSVRDVSRSSIQDLGRNSGGQRLLRLGLTDGVTEITAIEFSHVPAIPDDVVPGTKVFIFSCCELVEQPASLMFLFSIIFRLFFFYGTIRIRNS